MLNRLKKIRIILLALILVLNSLCLTSCNENLSNKVDLADNQFLDASNRVITIRKNSDKVTAASVYAVSVPFFVALKMTDRVKAVNTKSKFWLEADENLAKADNVGRGIVDIEKLAKVNPTCLVHRLNDEKTIEIVNQFGVDVLCIRVENVDDVINTLDVMGKYFGASDEANRVINYINEKFNKIDNIVKNIDDSEKKTAILMGGSIGRVAGSDMLQSFMIQKAGGICKIEETRNNNWIDIGLERIFEYNPDFIFLTSSTRLDYDEEDILNDKAWSGMNAIKSKNVYQIPSRADTWDMPGISCVIGTMYMLHKMYPNYFSKEELKKEIDEYYLLMFNKTFDEKYLGYSLD